VSTIQSKNIVMIPIAQIVPNPKNANKHSDEQIDRLCDLIKFQGFRNPLIVSNRTGFLVVGHGRLEAAKKLGMTELPVIKQDFNDEAQEYAYLVSDNEIARWAEFDKDKFNEDMKEFDLDIELYGLKNFEKIEQQIKDDPEVEMTFEYKIEIDCKDEMTQQSLMSEIKDRGLKVRILL